MPDGARAVLYAPTHREYGADDTGLLDLGAVAAGLGPEFVVLARAHYFSTRRCSRRRRAAARACATSAAHPSVEELCLAADVLVTDYSSVMFDYAVLDRPIVVHAADWDIYRERRGTYFDLRDQPPGVIARDRGRADRGAALRATRRATTRPAARAAFRARFCALEDGGAAERVVRRVWLGERAASSAPAGRGHPMSDLVLRRRRRAQRHEPARRDPRAGRLPHSAARGQRRRHQPRGFGEPRWVVDFHRRLMRQRRVTVFDARPAAWEATGAAAVDEAVASELRAWLKAQLDEASDVVVKDPRTSWFEALWTRCAADLGVRTSFVTMLRHPAEILTSARRWYGDWQTDASRAASWLNVMLETERFTRETRRVYVRYEDLLADWAPQLRRAGEVLDIPRLASVEADQFPQVAEFIDPGLHRSRTRWDDLAVPASLQNMCEGVWERFELLAAPDADEPLVRAALDESRAVYAEPLCGGRGDRPVLGDGGQAAQAGGPEAATAGAARAAHPRGAPHPRAAPQARAQVARALRVGGFRPPAGFRAPRGRGVWSGISLSATQRPHPSPGCPEPCAQVGALDPREHAIHDARGRPSVIQFAERVTELAVARARTPPACPSRSRSASASWAVVRSRGPGDLAAKSK